ncbi:MAG: sulfite exporter TauE/SafE family protein [Cyanobacteria bacterium J06642_3]
MLDLLLIVALGFLGSFGHCVGMCGPLTVALALSQERSSVTTNGFRFHLWLNIGRLISYTLVGGALGGLGSIVVVSGQLAGIGSSLRQFMAIFTGVLLIWFGIGQIKPNWLPGIPFLHPLKGGVHNQLNSGMNRLATISRWWTPAILGGVWGLIPCGFLYAAQLKAVETGSLLTGAITMFCFGLGTVPMMLLVGSSASKISADRRSQLFRLGGWITLTIGILTLLRTDAMVDYTGHGALLLLMLALVARPLSVWWTAPLRYRRILGVGSFVLTVAHTAHMLDHSLNWNLDAIAFMLPQHRLGMVGGILSLFLMAPAAVTSSDRLQASLGQRWRQIHLLTVPALIFAVSHTVLLGSHYLGDLQLSFSGKLRAVTVLLLAVVILIMRSSLGKNLIGQTKSYNSTGTKSRQ